MAKRLDKFTKPFAHSSIPFLLAEVVTDGTGEMVDLTCRFLNAPAAGLLGVTVEEAASRRFCHVFPPELLTALKPLQAVAFSGGCQAVPFTTATGDLIDFVCYQPLYGLVACVLEPQTSQPPPPSPENGHGTELLLELSRRGLRLLSFSQALCALTGWSRKGVLERFTQEFSALVAPEDWPALLQALLDAARESRAVQHDVRLLRQEGPPVWVRLQAPPPERRSGVTVFHGALVDIDQLRCAQDRLAETSAALDNAHSQFQQLFDCLPGGYGLFRLSPEETLTPLRVSRGLTELLGQPEQELTRRLAQDSLWWVLPADREELNAAAMGAQAMGVPLRHACRCLSKNNGVLWVLLDVSWQHQPDGSTLLYAACSDATREKEAESELRFQSHLCDLLLDKSRIICFDYDPATDTARLETFDAQGRRVTRTFPDYLDTFSQSETIHPDDRRHLAAALRRSTGRPGTETLEYRGDYDKQGWRWYRMSWMSLADGRGVVHRLVGKAEDISSRKAADQRFRGLVARQKLLSRKALSFCRLDLSANRPLDGRCTSRYLTQALWGDTADECIRRMEAQIAAPAYQAEFRGTFARTALLDAFGRGIAHFGQEHPLLSDDTGTSLWVRSTLELAENPENHHVEAFFYTLDASSGQLRDAVLQTLAQRNYALVATVNTATGVYRSHREGATAAGAAYRTLVTQLLGPRATAVQKAALRLETVQSALEGDACYTLICPPLEEEGAIELCWSWLDRERGMLLLTGQRRL